MRGILYFLRRCDPRVLGLFYESGQGETPFVSEPTHKSQVCETNEFSTTRFHLGQFFVLITQLKAK